MRQTLIFCTSVIALMVPLLASAQDRCKDLLQYAAKNESQEVYQNSVAESIYINHCETNSAKSTSLKSSNLDVVVKTIPIRFGSRKGSSGEKLNEFCKTYSKDFKSNLDIVVQKSLTVIEAVDAWENCMLLVDRGVQFKTAMGSQLVSIGIKRLTAVPYVFQGATYNSDHLSCSAPDSDADQNTVYVDSNTRKELTDKYWSITCIRKGIETANYTLFPKTEMILNTGAGPYLLPLPETQNVYTEWGTHISAKIAELESKVDFLSEKRNKLECKTTHFSSPIANYPIATAAMPKEHVDEGSWAITGGSCSITGYAGADDKLTAGQYVPNGHNPPITVSRQNGLKWECKAGEPPHTPMNFSITAYVNYCRIKPDT